MSCLFSSFYTMTVAVGTQETVQSGTGAIHRTWNYSADEINCLVSGIKSGGVRSIGSTENWSQSYESVDWLRMRTSVSLTKRHRVKDIKTSDGNIVWEGEYEIVGITPIVAPIGGILEYEVVLKRAEVQ